MINHKLKLARQAAGLSLRQLEASIGKRVTAQAIGKYERGEAQPSPDVLAAICTALKIQPEQIQGNRSIALESIEFRKSPLALKKEEMAVQAQLLQHIENYLAIEDALSIKSSAWDLPRGGPYPIHATHDLERAAYAVRADWGLGSDPIRSFTALLEDRGIKVVSLALNNIDGFAATVRTHSNSLIPVIATNRDNWSERKRFTLAHELSHLVCNVVGTLDVERAANHFAGAFLMPAETLRAELGNHRTSISLGELLQVKKVFGVSMQALTYRCKEIGIISQTLFKQLFDVFTERGWRTYPYQEPDAIDPAQEMPIKLKRLCLRGLSEGLIDEETASRALGKSHYEIADIMTANVERVQN